MRKCIYVSKADSITRFENNLVNLKTGDAVYCELEPRMLFPVSRTEEYISLINSEGKEIALIRSLCDLNSESKKVILESLEDYYLVPKITKLISTQNKNGTIVWECETTRGPKTFEIRNRNHDIKASDNGAVRVRDSHDNRYVIDNWHELDKKSRRLLVIDI